MLLLLLNDRQSSIVNKTLAPRDAYLHTSWDKVPCSPWTRTRLTGPESAKCPTPAGPRLTAHRYLQTSESDLNSYTASVASIRFVYSFCFFVYFDLLIINYFLLRHAFQADSGLATGPEPATTMLVFTVCRRPTPARPRETDIRYELFTLFKSHICT
jgi:hypothetical protein